MLIPFTIGAIILIAAAWIKYNYPKQGQRALYCIIAGGVISLAFFIGKFLERIRMRKLCSSCSTSLRDDHSLANATLFSCGFVITALLMLLILSVISPKNKK
jgi:hypothetical protein